MTKFSIKANLIDLVNRTIYPAEVFIEDGKISNINRIKEKLNNYVLPGFVDSHIHIESSMLTPVEFSRAVIIHGTVATVSDPHEIANVLGRKGIEYMLDNAKLTPLKILFGAPSCVPATDFESSGAKITSSDIAELLDMENIGYLSEMMNYPGVIYDDDEVLKKLSIAKYKNYPIDGHAPGVKGDDLKKYCESGISTDHECFTIEEAREKISHGMHIQIREGSGAKNFENLVPLLNEFPEKIMFCSDDLHPDDLLNGHINLLVKRAIQLGYDMFDVLRAAGYNGIQHYNLNVGLLRVGDPADFITVNSLEDWRVDSVCIDGVYCFEKGELRVAKVVAAAINKFEALEIKEKDIAILARAKTLKVIQVIDGELITKTKIVNNISLGEHVRSDIEEDILKIVVLNRYENSAPAIGFINGFGLKKGAIASSIAHDSHNIICVGTSDYDITETINWIINNKGGIVAYNGNTFTGLPLPVAGIITNQTAEYAAEKYIKASDLAKELGSELKAPFMTLAFMTLLVIPELKLSDKGLFDGKNFAFTPLFE